MNIALGPPTLVVTRLDVQIDSAKQTDVYFFAHVPNELSPIGILVVGLEDGENSGWVSRVFVEPEHRGKGVASSLLQSAASLCEEKKRGFLSLAVSNKNKAAQRVYKAAGFVSFMAGQKGYTQYIKAL